MRFPKLTSFLLLAAVFFTGAAQAHETPELLAQAYVQAKNASDPEQLKALLHPDFIRFFLKRGPVALEQMLARWAEGEAPTAYDIELINMVHVPTYHAKTQEWRIGPDQTVYFPVAPELLLQFWVTPEEGERTAGENFAVSSKEGLWYIVFSDL